MAKNTFEYNDNETKIYPNENEIIGCFLKVKMNTKNVTNTIAMPAIMFALNPLFNGVELYE